MLYLQISALGCHGLTILSRHPLLHTLTVPLHTRIQDVLDERLVTRAFVGATVAVSKLVKVTLQRYLDLDSWTRNNVVGLGSQARGAGHSDRPSFDHLVRGGGEQIPASCLHISISPRQDVYSHVREQQAGQLLSFASNYAATHSGDLVIIAGDLNSTPLSPVEH